MSRRTVLRFALLSLLATTLASPVAAQEIFEAPMPRAMDCGLPIGWWLSENHGPQALSVMVVPCSETPTRLTGTWCRDLGELVVAATFTGEEMTLHLSTEQDGLKIGITLTADYGVSKQGLVHGVVTGVDVNVKRGPNAEKAPSGMEVAEYGAELQKLIDCPFSFRIKPTSAGVMVSNLKLAAQDFDEKELAAACGMYKPEVEGKCPELKTTSDRKCVLSGMCLGMTLPSERYLKHSPEYYPPDPQGALRRAIMAQESSESVPPMSRPMPPGAVVPTGDTKERLKQYYGGGSIPVGVKDDGLCPHCPAQHAQAAPPPCYAPPKPVNVPPTEFGMMADVFGQMLGSPPCPVQPTALKNASPRPLPVSPVVATRPIVGTWVREVGPFMYVVKITPDQITITAKAATELEGGKTAVDGMIVTAEYHLARDGVTAVGLVTGVDARLEGELDGADINALQEELARFQKALTDKPFAMSLRSHDDSLVIGNVRLPEVNNLKGGPSPLTALGGCYSPAGDKPLPKLKPVKAVPPPPPPYPVPGGGPPFVGGPGLPPPPFPSGASPSPYAAAPPGTVDASVIPGRPGAPPEIEDRIPPPTPRVTETPPSAPPPIPPATDSPKEGKKGKKGHKKKKDVAVEVPPELR